MKGIALSLVLVYWPVTALAQVRVTVSDLGPGPSGRLIRAALARPHLVVEPDTVWYQIPRDSQLRTSVVVLGRTAAVSGQVNGDVIVVGGDLFVRPGARITGRGIALGGGVYPSTRSFVGQGTENYRDNTFEIRRTPDGYDLAYQSLRAAASQPLLFPGVYGLRFPTYDRVNGASIPFGPAFSFLDGKGQLDLLVTYRSDLGKMDPSLAGSIQMTRRARATLDVRRGTRSNDAWIWSNFVNSLSSLFLGIDTRNHYRADRAEFAIMRLWETTQLQIEPFLGGIAEEAWTTGPGTNEPGSPWSLFGRTDSLGMRRPNPVINDGRIMSITGGATVFWESQGTHIQAHSRAEVALSGPLGNRFAQVTTDIETGFSTFDEQSYAMDVHWVTTPAGAPPLQRFVYLGGSGTLPFLDLLEQGGDEALLIDQRYSIPVPSIRLGLLGEPTLQLRHRMGSAGIGGLPRFEQVLGVGVMLTIIRGEVQVDPASGDIRASAGFTFSR